jgi:hypothetical protein
MKSPIIALLSLALVAVTSTMATGVPAKIYPTTANFQEIADGQATLFTQNHNYTILFFHACWW